MISRPPYQSATASPKNNAEIAPPMGISIHRPPQGKMFRMFFAQSGDWLNQTIAVQSMIPSPSPMKAPARTALRHDKRMPSLGRVFDRVATRTKPPKSAPRAAPIAPPTVKYTNKSRQASVVTFQSPVDPVGLPNIPRSEEHTSELQSPC